MTAITAIKSPVHRFGGKYFLRDFLVQHIPQHTLYCEPFCGAAHLLFSKRPSPVEVINDIDGLLINFFRLIREDAKRQELVKNNSIHAIFPKLMEEIRRNWKQGNI